MHIEPTRGQVEALLRSGIVGPIDMLNLLRFRDRADYGRSPELAPSAPSSGRAAYDRYAAHTMPFLQAAGGEVRWVAEHAGPLVIGPTEERWDRALLVRHRSVEAFLAFATDAAYLAGVGHRTAALADSRLLPLLAG